MLSARVLRGCSGLGDRLRKQACGSRDLRGRGVPANPQTQGAACLGAVEAYGRDCVSRRPRSHREGDLPVPGHRGAGPPHRHAHGPIVVEPAGAVVSLLIPGAPSSVRASFCDQVHFFASADAAKDWLAEHPGAQKSDSPSSSRSSPRERHPAAVDRRLRRLSTPRRAAVALPDMPAYGLGRADGGAAQRQ
ncbi:organomercurial lyase [Streptomyces sp. H27-H1]|uniref:organomercurial lyase n=1 Tax=Streptomyces sp. H27-H1 TaxID=2996461 RepID=UPI0022710575|nr:organomercurial lyase [Streptomyces sp. H27-H1]MCY0931502.1 organomercurial lyase [Streptomyces sp. H27-H1]